LDTEQIVANADIPEASVLEEKVYTQAEVNRIAGKVRAETSERTKRLLEEEYAVKAGESNKPVSVDYEKVYEEATKRVKADFEKEHQQQQEQQNAQAWGEIVKEYNSKLAAAAKSSEHEDFHEVMQDFNHTKYDFVVYGANKHENTADIMYELARDPERAIRLEHLGREDFKAFEKAMKKFSDSVKTNKEASKKAQSAPISRVKSDVVTSGASTTGDDDYLALKQKYYPRKN
jgi:glycerol-3-phosphate cytidylyltransferase-like family protein